MKVPQDLHGFPWVWCAGAEYYAHAVGKFLVEQGHEVRVLSGTCGKDIPEKEYVIDGIQVTLDATGEQRAELYKWCDCVITHLDQTRNAINDCRLYNKPLAHLVHNAGQLAYHKVQPSEAQLLIYNSRWLASKVRFPAPSIVCYPAVFCKDYEAPEAEVRDKYTLINMNENKGAHVFWAMVEDFPKRKFLAQKGSYGHQIIRKEVPPNVTVRECNPDIKPAYAQTHVLLIPSDMETWGRVAIEAAANHIPIIASPTDGLREALGPNGAIWCNRTDLDAWEAAIKSLDDVDTYLKYANAGYERAQFLEQKSEIQLNAVMYALYSMCCNNRNKLFCLASETQYLDHLAPIIHGLPLENVGCTFIFDNQSGNFQRTEAHAYDHNLVIFPLANRNFEIAKVENAIGAMADPSKSLLLVSSWRDHYHAKQISLMEGRLIRTEHGSGQSYSMAVGEASNPAFVGGNGHVGLFAALAPGKNAGLSIQNSTPNVPVALIGCPKLDWAAYRNFPKHETLTVAISFRYKTATEVPEQNSAFEFFRKDIEKLVAEGTNIKIIGHCHPFALHSVGPWWKLLNIEYVANFEEILDRADILLVDNSSIAFEWLQVKRPKAILGLLNSPEYRRYMDFGMRFWNLTEQPDVVQINPGEINENLIEQMPSVVSSVNFDNELQNTYELPLGKATIGAKNCIMQLLNHDLANTNEHQVRMLRNVDFQGMKASSGIYWLPNAEAEALIDKGYAVTQHRENPEPIVVTKIDLKSKQSWPVMNFVRYFQLTVLRWINGDVHEHQ